MEKELTEDLPSQSPSPDQENGAGVLSTLLPREEYLEIKNLSDSLGVSVSHVGRAIIRIGLINIRGVSQEAKEGLHLRLIKLGK